MVTMEEIVIDVKKEFEWTILRTQIFDVCMKFFDGLIQPGQTVVLQNTPSYVREVNSRKIFLVKSNKNVTASGVPCSASLLTRAHNYIVTIQVRAIFNSASVITLLLAIFKWI